MFGFKNSFAVVVFVGFEVEDTVDADDVFEAFKTPSKSADLLRLFSLESLFKSDLVGDNFWFLLFTNDGLKLFS